MNLKERYKEIDVAKDGFQNIDQILEFIIDIFNLQGIPKKHYLFKSIMVKEIDRKIVNKAFKKRNIDMPSDIELKFYIYTGHLPILC